VTQRPFRNFSGKPISIAGEQQQRRSTLEASRPAIAEGEILDCFYCRPSMAPIADRFAEVRNVGTGRQTRTQSTGSHELISVNSKRRFTGYFAMAEIKQIHCVLTCAENVG
jgi:hypothetical protein